MTGGALKSHLAVLAALFLLASLLPRQARGTTTSDDDLPTCYNEGEACGADDVCSSCSIGLGTSTWTGDAVIEWGDCVQDFDADLSDLCSAFSSWPCCFNTVFPNDCFASFVASWICQNSRTSIGNGGEACTAITCNDGAIATIADDASDTDDADGDDGGVDADGDGGGGDGDDGEDGNVSGDSAAGVGTPSPSAALGLLLLSAGLAAAFDHGVVL